MKRQLATAATCAGLLAFAAAPVLAQRVDASGTPYRAWDVSAGTGLHFMTTIDRVDSGRGGWSAPAPLGDVSIARYWNSHLKTEVGFTALTSGEDFADATITLPSGQVAHTYTTNRARQQQVAFSGVCQFFDNEFAHPYVSAGVRVGLLDIESHRSPYATVYSNNTYQSFLVPETTARLTQVKVRPFLALGSKAYFTERVFARPEVIVAASNRGVSQVGLNLGFGFDF
ncbi:MAG: hypothetical protein U0Q11_16715 [Vicinamibacterales bacterium]